ncbi:hypothetical protein FOCC_FOCC007072 [Frankliniella occidentalis]|nr:hypothetical protein FOCC_FOCC007072 [Frankliniella occidentalis]
MQTTRTQRRPARPFVIKVRPAEDEARQPRQPPARRPPIPVRKRSSENEARRLQVRLSRLSPGLEPPAPPGPARDPLELPPPPSPSSSAHSCEVCGKQYGHPMSLIQHRKIHLGSTTCSVCHKVLNRTHDLKIHMALKHGAIGGKVPAAQAQDAVKDTGAAQGGAQQRPSWRLGPYGLPSGAPPGAYPASANLLLNPMRGVASAVRPRLYPDGRRRYPCQFCDKTFAHRISVALHMSIHQGKTECHICRKVFSRAYNLKLHIQTVHAERHAERDRPPPPP